MDKSNKSILKVVVKYNNVVIFSSLRIEDCIAFALNLHNVSNEPHSIDVCSEDVTYVALFTRK